ncbi:MAG: Nramp family divalent metal transporter [Bacteroidia bacterium]|nr:Nramp family divalent metal transporter [Bacteroidia bacterium]
MTPITDPYIISDKTVKEPPSALYRQLAFLGPGFILSASIVGSGELIATTVLGAKAGFAALWIILISCLAKVAVQLEFGKHAILTGETAMQAFNKLPGLTLGKGKWIVWTIFLLAILKIVQIGGILGGTVIVLNMLFSGFSTSTWTIITTLVVGALIFNGRYGWIEKFSLLMIAMFTILTITSLISLRYTVYSFSFSDILDGLRFNLSGEIVGIAIGAFGITGVASDEIIAYNYWCLEKGYASYTGPRQETQEWKKRAQGWINIMYLDAFVAMIIYTVVTIAFYLLGAAVLHNRGDIPQGNQVIETIALIYTQSLGPGVKNVYLVGAFFALFSSLFASLAAWTRLYADIFGQIGWIDFSNVDQRRKMIAIFAWLFPFTWAAAYLFIDSPVLMVLSGGVVGSFMLFIVIFAALHFKYKRTTLVTSGLLYDTAFWISVISILGVGVYGIMKVIL